MSNVPIQITGEGVDVVENGDIFNIVFGNNVMISDRFDEFTFELDDQDISSDFQLLSQLPNDTLIVQYLGVSLTNPFIEIGNFSIENVINEVASDYVSFWPKGNTHRVYNDNYNYILGDPKFYISPPLHDWNESDSNYTFNIII